MSLRWSDLRGSRFLYGESMNRGAANRRCVGAVIMIRLLQALGCTSTNLSGGSLQPATQHDDELPPPGLRANPPPQHRQTQFVAGAPISCRSVIERRVRVGVAGAEKRGGCRCAEHHVGKGARIGAPWQATNPKQSRGERQQ